MSRQAWICVGDIVLDSECPDPGHEGACVEGTFRTIPEQEAHDKATFAAGAESALLQLSTMISVYRADGADAEDMPGLQEVERFISVLIPKKTGAELAEFVAGIEAKALERAAELTASLDLWTRQYDKKGYCEAYVTCNQDAAATIRALSTHDEERG